MTISITLSGAGTTRKEGDELPFNTPLIEAKDIYKYYPVSKGMFRAGTEAIHALNGINLALEKGETLGLVGESGCGKSTFGRVLVRLENGYEGKVYYEGKDVTTLRREALKVFRRKVQVVFQDPFSSLNPRMKVGTIVREPLDIHHIGSPPEREERLYGLLNLVGLRKDHVKRYPHEFSGGQRQRIGLARALSLNPDLIVCDEPVSSLDVSIQAQVLNLFLELQEKLRLTYLFISHDLHVVQFISDRVAVMYLGKIFEIAPKDALYREPLSPYTQALLAASPVPDPEKERPVIRLEGEMPDPIHLPSGCLFHPRCPNRKEICKELPPALVEVEPRHFVRCFLHHDVPEESG